MRNSENHRPSYVGLVAALRGEFNPMQLEALWIQMREHRYATSSLGTLAQAVHDAQDINYDAGETVHPAVKAWLDRHGPRQDATATRPYLSSTNSPEGIRSHGSEATRGAVREAEPGAPADGVESAGAEDRRGEGRDLPGASEEVEPQLAPISEPIEAPGMSALTDEEWAAINGGDR